MVAIHRCWLYQGTTEVYGDMIHRVHRSKVIILVRLSGVMPLCGAPNDENVGPTFGLALAGASLGPTVTYFQGREDTRSDLPRRSAQSRPEAARFAWLLGFISW